MASQSCKITKNRLIVLLYECVVTNFYCPSNLTHVYTRFKEILSGIIYGICFQCIALHIEVLNRAYGYGCIGVNDFRDCQRHWRKNQSPINTGVLNHGHHLGFDRFSFRLFLAKIHRFSLAMMIHNVNFNSFNDIQHSE